MFAAGGAVLGSAFKGANLYQGIANSFPSIEDEAICTVYLQPGADKQQAYFLALSVCFGLVHRLDAFQGLAPPAGAIMIEYGGEPWVRATVRYRTSLLSAAIASGKFGAVGNITEAWGDVASLNFSSARDRFNDAGAQIMGFLAGADTHGVSNPRTTGEANPSRAFTYDFSTNPNNDLKLYKNLAVMSGPKTDHILVGGPWSFTGSLIPGLPSTSTSPGAPQLPFADRVIATADSHCYDPNPSIHPPTAAPIIRAEAPRPPGDGRSRGSIRFPDYDKTNFVSPNYMVALVHAALSNPGSVDGMTFPSPGTPAQHGHYL